MRKEIIIGEAFNMNWKIKVFNNLSVNEFHEIVKSRFEVFVVEQKVTCENEFDDIDKISHHIYLEDDGKVLAYSRIIPKGVRYEEPSIGRVLVLKEFRKKGIGLEMMRKCIDFIKNEWKEEHIVLSSQVRSKHLYLSAGFKEISDVYMEAEIPHVKMRL